MRLYLKTNALSTLFWPILEIIITTFLVAIATYLCYTAFKGSVIMKDIFSQNPLFSGMNETERENALSIFSTKEREYKKNQLIASAGERLTRFGFVLSGTVQVSFSDIDGNEVIMASVSAGDTFGESLCWLKVSEIPVTITAFTDVKMLWLSPDEMRNAKSEGALELHNRFSCLLAQKTLSMNERIQILTKPTIRQKIITFLSQYKNRHGCRAFQIPFDRETLALYLGVNRSALSRELSLMQKEGIIEFYKNTFKILK